MKHSESTEKMEDASRGYGLLLHAFGLRTEPVRAQHFAKIKTKVNFEWSMKLACGIYNATWTSTYILHSFYFSLSLVRYAATFQMMKPSKKWKKSWWAVRKTILGKSLNSHGSLSLSQTHSLSANQRVSTTGSIAKSMVTGISMQRILDSYTLDQLYTEAMRVN